MMSPIARIKAKVRLSLAWLVSVSLTFSVFASDRSLTIDFDGPDKLMEEALRLDASTSFLFPSGGTPAKVTQEVFESIASGQPDFLIFSGHSGAFRFSGHLGAFDSEEAKRSGATFPSVKAIALRGCYSGVLDASLDDSPWRALFPNLELILGYPSKAWSREHAEASEFIRLAFLLHRAAPADRESIFMSWSGHSRSEVSLSLLRDRRLIDFWATRYQNKTPFHLDVKEIRNSCKRDQRESSERELRFSAGQLMDIDVDRRAELRSHYDWFRQRQHCRTLNIWPYGKWSDPDRQIFTFYRENVVRNYLAFVSLSEINMLLLYGAGEVPDLLKLHESREIQAWVAESLTLLSIACASNDCRVPDELRPWLDSVANSFTQIVLNHDPRVLSLQWATSDRINYWPILLDNPENKKGITANAIPKLLESQL
ncbi:hypothetical protein [Dokdonella sp.]|uniref:hypothetical protein n=1 Tax=Dokdonella sp. TaxID=2291710 RepID=UPI003529D151